MDKDIKSLQTRRENVMGRNAKLFYDEPVEIVRAKGVRLWDADGREYLDCYNNVPCIGHCHPEFVKSVADQLARLNTHTRYLHEAVVGYLEDLTGTFAAGFDAGLMTCTGSEANDAAIRLARLATGARGMIATNHTYHGNTHLVSQLSKNKIPIGGHEPYVRHVSAPDSYRGFDPEEFAAETESVILDLKDNGQGFAALVICPLFANEGFPDLPSGSLKPTENVVRKHGGLIICDEVQSGFGRTGTMWAHERIGITPDIVTMGKPMASGYPAGGFVTSRDLMNKFRSAYGYFNTFGGSPVAATAAQKTLDIIRDEGLVDNAREVGSYAKVKLEELKNKYECIGDCRGAGLFFGAELVSNRVEKTPDSVFADKVVNAMRRRGVLLSSLGIHYNTLKIRPPLVFSKSDADELFENLDHVIGEEAVDQPG